MAEYKSVVIWSRGGAVFTDNRYSRGHRWLFDGGVEVPASSSPHAVPIPLSVAAAVDPEEAFVARVLEVDWLSNSRENLTLDLRVTRPAVDRFRTARRVGVPSHVKRTST